MAINECKTKVIMPSHPDWGSQIVQLAQELRHEVDCGRGKLVHDRYLIEDPVVGTEMGCYDSPILYGVRYVMLMMVCG